MVKRRNTKRKNRGGSCGCTSGPSSGIFKGGNNNLIENNNCTGAISLKGGSQEFLIPTVPYNNYLNGDPIYSALQERLVGGKRKIKNTRKKKTKKTKKRKSNKIKKGKKIRGGFNLFSSSTIIDQPSFNIFATGTIPTI